MSKRRVRLVKSTEGEWMGFYVYERTNKRLRAKELKHTYIRAYPTNTYKIGAMNETNSCSK